jgi:MarR family transcriptional regulator for hemolysin
MKAAPRTLLPASLAVEVARMIASARRLVWNAAARSLDSIGESMLAWQILFRLIQNGPSTQRDLADAIAQHPAGVSRVLLDMEERGMVRRRRSRRDRRKMVVAATPAGMRRLEKDRPLVVRAVEEVLRPLAPREQRALRGLLGKLVEPPPRGPASHRGQRSRDGHGR